MASTESLNELVDEIKDSVYEEGPGDMRLALGHIVSQLVTVLDSDPNFTDKMRWDIYGACDREGG